MTTIALVRRQVRFEQREFWRNRSRAAFSIAFPLVFLVVFNALNSGKTVDELGGIPYATWFIPGILAYGIIMATYNNLAIATTNARDTGILKRVRGTPMPAGSFLAGRVLSTLVTAGVLTVATLVLAVTRYDVTVRTQTLPGLVAAVVLGSLCFTALGLAVTAVIPNADAAPAITNLTVLPLTFISGIFMVSTASAGWIDAVAKAFPVRALAHSLQHAFDPATVGSGLVAGDLLVLAAWTAVGVGASLRWFRWEAR